MHVRARSCVLLLWVYTLTVVKGQGCTKDMFIKSNLYDENFDTSGMDNSYTLGKQVRVSCKVGFTGFYKITCTTDGWTARGQRCQARSCGHPGDAQFADFHLEEGDDFVFGSKVVYTCHKGYHMVSRVNYRRCMVGGWDGLVPVCEAQQCPAIFVDDNVQVNGDLEEANYGNVVRFSCKSHGDILIGATELYCDDSGKWSGEAPTCEVLRCKPPEIENGVVLGDKLEYNEDDILHFECNYKFKRTEERPSKCIKIGVRADWSPTPLCEPVKCRLKLPPLEGTSYEPAFRNVFSPDESLRVTCGYKFYISDPRKTSVETRCGADGEWTIRPVCLEVTCRNQRPRHVHSWDLYWGQKITLDDTTRYSCSSGYKSTDGTNVARCTREGWKPDPLCQEITCHTKDIYFSNGDVDDPNKQIYRFNGRVYFNCHRGFRGNPSRVCKENGWTGNSRCTEITCSREVFEYAEAEDIGYSDEFRYSEQVKFICKNGYKGSFTRTCDERGWTGATECSEIICERRDIYIANADKVDRYKYQFKDNEVARYVCQDGYEGNPTRTCGADGWTGETKCTVKRCQKPVIEGADVTDVADVTGALRERYDHGEEVQYTCKKVPAKQFTATCDKGAWTGTEECSDLQCEKPDIKHGRIVSREKASYRNKDQVYYTCKNDVGPRHTATCEKGVWTETQSCPACPKANDPNGFSKLIENGEMLQYTCNQGYKLPTNKWWGRALCINSVWSGFVSCIEETKCGEIPVILNAAMTLEDKVYEQNQTVEVVCKEGYEAKANLTCDGGNWSFDGLSLEDICARMVNGCGPPPKFDNTVVVSTSYKTEFSKDSEVTYKCRPNYEMAEGNTRIFRCNGKTWDGDEIICTPRAQRERTADVAVGQGRSR